MRTTPDTGKITTESPSFLKAILGIVPILLLALMMGLVASNLDSEERTGLTEEQANKLFLRAGVFWSAPSPPASPAEQAAYQTLWGCVEKKRQTREGWGWGRSKGSDPLALIETPEHVIKNCEIQATFWPATTTPELQAAVNRRRTGWSPAAPPAR